MSTATSYTAKDITVLEGLEPVRKRPSMYIGGVDGKGLHHLVWEIVDNAVDEYLNGHADAIAVTLHKNGDAVTVQDNGRGIPVDSHPKYKKTGLEIVLTVLHGGGKFGDNDAYIHSGLKITFKNEITKETFDLTHPGGIPEFLGRLVTEGQKPAVTEQPFTLARTNGDKMEVALQWTESTDEVIRSYVNGIRTSSGGTHETGFKNGIAKAIRNFMETHDVKVKGLEITAEDIREGIVGILSVFVREPQ